MWVIEFVNSRRRVFGAAVPQSVCYGEEFDAVFAGSVRS